jgi:gamma-glutamyltranspeptidase/glutathione hydrolase
LTDTSQNAFEWPWLDRVPGSTAGHLGGRAVVGGRGMVVAPQPLAAECGVAVLRAGGNAVDAAIAASAMLMVTSPMNCGPGGDAIWLVRPAGGPAVVVNGTGRSGGRLDPDRARAAAAHDRDRGAWTVTVPGAVASWVAALDRFGSMSLAELLQPAVEAAENGFFVSRWLHAALSAAESVLRRSPEGTAWFLADGVPAVHSRLGQPELARCLRLLASTGGDALYRGEIAAAIVHTLTQAGGFIDEDDLATHETRWDEPLTTDIGDLELLQAPPNSQGIVLLEALRLTSLTLDKPFPDLGLVEDVHVLVESLRASLADRDAVVADPEQQDGLLATLLDDSYLSARASAIDPAAASPGWEAGTGHAVAGAAARDGDTANLVVADESGMAVSLTQSLYYDFGSGIPVRDWGFMLHNRGACFSLAPAARNTIGPGRRPLHTLMPGMALADGHVRYIFGCMGGHGQAQTQSQLLSRLAAGDDPQEAVAAPRFFADPGRAEPVLYLEARAAALKEGLLARAHPLELLGDWEEIMGHAQLIELEPSGALVGGSDPRTDGHVATW